MPESNEQYVYIHRDEAGDPVYIGRGRSPTRAVSHDGDDLSELLARGTFAVEIAGPFATVRSSEDVEAALISAFSNTPSLAAKLINKAPGVSRAVFRPLGVPQGLGERVLQDPVDKAAILKVSNGASVLCVLIKEHVTRDGRDGYHLAQVPSDDLIRERMVKSWALGRNIEAWKLDPEKTPSVLLALSGPIKHRMIVASVAIAQDLARFSRVKGQLFEVPLADVTENDGLDFGGLRGRRIARDVTKFGHFRHELFSIVEGEGARACVDEPDNP